MSAANGTHAGLSSFLLLGIPGLEAAYQWLSIPLSSMYVVTVLGNSALLFIIRGEPSLHKPMYLFLSMLAAVDLVISSATLPKTLCIFWFKGGEISFGGCLAQMFFIHSFSVMETAVLVAMAFDRYVAICFPLRYESILTSPVLLKIGVAVVLRAFALITPLPILASRLPFCASNKVPHTYCQHMAVVKLACADVTLNSLYGMGVALYVGLFDVLLIVLSYGLILRAVFRLPSKEARLKAFNTCGSHICVILIAIVPGLFSILTHRFSHKVAPHARILLANLYLLVPPTLNPIVYGVKTKEIRDRVFHVFWKRRRAALKTPAGGME
ncbi:olfactory receptor 52E8-like [Eublepharis macularius]|uniref:Olfactory receptor n=1 Tax=Eublepharis macularius TaxID=481883 RepID=A0AA97KUL2_EUBMA|nr:olfactory receptor 52E8-like [Eublepharis macularius]